MMYLLHLYPINPRIFQLRVLFGNDETAMHDCYDEINYYVLRVRVRVRVLPEPDGRICSCTETPKVRTI